MSLSWKQKFHAYLLEYDEDEAEACRYSLPELIGFNIACITCILLYIWLFALIVALSPIWGIPYLICRFIRKEHSK